MKQFFLLVTFFLIAHSLLEAQSGFKYQAVIRDENGAILSQQNISLRIGIIQNAIFNVPDYMETHAATTNDYGVVNLTIGQGALVEGDFSSLDWSKNTFAQIEIDISGGNNFSMLGTSELMAVPKAMYAETAKSVSNAFGLNVKDFGAIGDQTTDDTEAFQMAIDSAALLGNKVMVPAGNYLITKTLIVPDGISIIGESTGSTALGSPHNGSAIYYAGSGFALKFLGHNAGMRDILIYDQEQGNNNASGILIQANGQLVESLRFFNILIHYFTGGTGLKLEAVNGGGIAYCSFYNVRVRNAKTGIHILEDSPSFTNSNTFQHGVVSGGGFDFGILIDGGNNNQFYGTVIEPSKTNNGHLVIRKGEIQGHNIRIEGSQQSAQVPLVDCKAGTQNSVITGTYGGGLTLDRGNNSIEFRSGKSSLYQNNNDNLFENAGFNGFDGQSLAFWDVSGNGVTAQVLTPELTPEHRVLKLTIPSGVVANLEASANNIPAMKNLPLYSQMNVGIHAKISHPDIAYWRTNAPQGVTISQPHSGDGQWQYVSMNQQVKTNTTLDTRFEINNNTGESIEVYLTTPSFNFGNQSPKLNLKPINSNGGIITGVLTQSLVSVSGPPSGTFWELPLEGNYFEINGTGSMHRINAVAGVRFPKGTVITLLFNNGGLSVLNSGYIKLKANFTSIANSSLSLMSLGNGTWREINRNL